MREAAFIPPMLLLRTHTLPDGPQWRYELKHDGYRAVAFKSAGKLFLRSRNNKDFADRYPEILEGLAKLPDETVIDGEVVALDKSGRPSFNALQNSASSARELVYYVYDVMILAGKDVMAEPFEKRRKLLEKKILPKLTEPVRYSSTLNVKLPDLVESVKAAALEGLDR
jgi:bifunctional non-homologous end joining protein LigD